MSEQETAAPVRCRRALLLTVGTGTAEQLEATIITPFRKSFEEGEWDQIVLLPSKTSEANARLLQERFGQFPIEVRPLRLPGDEDNADAAFRHFDEVILRLLAKGFRAQDCTADITRGTKAMTAALALAAINHRLGHLRYIAASQRDERGMVVAGTERVDDVEPRIIAQRQDLNQAFAFLRAGNFRAAEQLLPADPPEGHLKKEIRFARWAAQFWGAWDRFDYKEAKRLASRPNLPDVPPASIEPYLPSEQQIAHLETLAGEAPPEAKDNPAYCRALAADLIANAERRFREGQNEEVLVRLYRVFELIGQYRLFEHGIDTGKPDVSDPRLRAWLESQGKPLPGREAEELRLPRLEAAKLLEFLEKSEPGRGGPDVGQRLVGLSWLGEWGPEMRNTSLLIHGFKARTRGRENELKKLLKQTRDFYQSEDGGNAQRLEACRFPFLEGAPAGNVPAEGRDNVVNVEPSRRASAE